MTSLNRYPAGTTIYIPFATYGASGESLTMSGLAVTDIEIYKDGSTTQRASDNGYTLLDTDGIDFDGITGIHGFSVDLSDNSTAGFYAVGSQYTVVVSAVTVNSQTVSFIADRFVITGAGDPDTEHYTIVKDATSQSIYFTARNQWGGPLTGLAFGASGLTAYYTRAGAAATAITLATQTAGGAFSSGGLVLVSDTNAPGLIRLDVPDAALVTGVDTVSIVLKGAANMVEKTLKIELVTDLPVTNGGIKADSTGTTAQTEIQTAAAAAIVAASLATATALADAQTDVDAILVDTNELQSALTGGRMKSAVEVVAGEVLQGAGTEADPWRPV